MCLLKVYIEGMREGDRILITSNVMRISADNGTFRVFNIDGEEKIISGADFSMVDALNSIFVLKARRGVKIKG